MYLKGGIVVEKTVMIVSTGEEIVIPNVFAMTVMWNGLEVVAWRKQNGYYGMQYLGSIDKEPFVTEQTEQLVHGYFADGSYKMR